MRKCAICGIPANGEEHHMIPKFIFKMAGIDANPDLYRIVLCWQHHKEMSQLWSKIMFSLRGKHD